MRPSARSAPVMTRPPASTGVRVGDVAGLRAGDVVEVRRWDTVCHRGEVDAVCPLLTVLWILDGPLRHRTMVDASEHTLWRMPRQTRIT